MSYSRELGGYVRHAERHGTAGVFDAACGDGFEPVELGRLALELRRLDPAWRVPPERREPLARALLAEHVPAVDVRTATGLDANRLPALAREVPPPENGALRKPVGLDGSDHDSGLPTQPGLPGHGGLRKGGAAQTAVLAKLAAGPATTAELAATRDALDRLERRGLVRRAGKRNGAGRPAVVWALPAEDGP